MFICICLSLCRFVFVKGEEWIEARFGFRAAVVDNVIHVTGRDQNNITTDSEIDSVTWAKIGNDIAPLELVANLAIRWRHLHSVQIWPPDGATFISSKFDHQTAPGGGAHFWSKKFRRGFCGNFEGKKQRIFKNTGGVPRRKYVNFDPPPCPHPWKKCLIPGSKNEIFLHFCTNLRSERVVSAIFPPYIMTNGTNEGKKYFAIPSL